MKPRPLIGITTDYTDDEKQYESPMAYSIAVEKAGGVPVLLPYNVDLSVIPTLIARLDGFIFSGGNDLDPAAYGEPYHPKAAPIDPRRERFERALMTAVEAKRAPTLGICLGSQLMNLHRGGSLEQYLPDVNRNDPREHGRLEKGIETRHPVTLVPDTSAYLAVGHAEVDANSSHKQVVKTPGRGLRVVATSADGFIEGVEDPSMPLWLGVQWHPERLHDEPDHLALFKLLIAKAGG